MSRSLLWFLLLFFSFFSGGGEAASQQRAEFSAEVVRSDPAHPGTTTSGMMYVGRDGIRTETSQDDQMVWMIFRPASKSVWTIFPKQQVYMERANLPLEWPPLPEDENSPCRNKNFRCKKVGTQKIHDRLTAHWVIHTVNEKGETPYAQMWVDPRLNVAIREAYADGLTVEMRKIRESAQAPQLFELPAGYKKMALPPAPVKK